MAAQRPANVDLRRASSRPKSYVDQEAMAAPDTLSMRSHWRKLQAANWNIGT